MFKVKEGISLGGKVVTGSGPSAVLTVADVGTGAFGPAYILPLASAGTLGGVKVGTGLSIDGSGVLSAAGATNLAQGTNTTTTVIVTSSTGTSATLTAATGSVAGILTAADWTTFNSKQNYLESKRSVTASTTTTSIDLNNGDKASVFKVTMGSNTTITFSNPPAAAGGEVFSFSMITVNDGTAGRTLAFGNTIKWAGGILPTRTTAANAVDVWTFFIENSVYYGSLSIIDAK